MNTLSSGLPAALIARCAALVLLVPRASVAQYNTAEISGVVVANVIYALPGPGGRGVLSTIGRDWQVTGIATLQSGSPFTMNLGTDVANIGSGPAQRPNVTCDPNSGGAGTSQQWFNTSCFALPAVFTFGNSGRNTVIGPNRAAFTANFGRIFSADPARQTQVGITLIFRSR